MDKLINGILKINDVSTIGLGTHYYPSYHPLKVPVLDSSQRYAEAIKDLQDMQALGFNIVRIASIGKTEKISNQFVCDTTFQDTLIELAKDNGLAVFVRLNGYGTNFANVENPYLKDQEGKDIPEKWDYFLRNNLHNAKLKKDDIDLSITLANHYNQYDNVLAYQIYNEPAFPHLGFYSYTPETLAKWQQLNNHNRIPPKTRPSINDYPSFMDWLSFRSFCNDSLNEYLNNISSALHHNNPNNKTFTCLTPCGIQQGSAIRGTDYFMIAKEMDFLGITLYLDPLGVKYYEYSRILDFAESAAAQYHKHAWVIECDARTNLDAFDYELIYHSILAAGMKGIMPYQYRADVVCDGAIEPNGYGIINNDRSQTVKYVITKKLHQLINKISKPLAESERETNSIGIFYSKDANLYCDALQNGDNLNAWKNKETSVIYANRLYYDLKKAHLSPFFVNNEGLLKRKMDLLLVPTLMGLTQKELDNLQLLIQRNVEVRVYNPIIDAYEKLDESDALALDDLLEKLHIKAFVKFEKSTLDVKMVASEKDCFLFLLNRNQNRQPIDNLLLELNFDVGNIQEATLLSLNKTKKIQIKNNKIRIKQINAAAIIWIKKE